MPFRAHPLPIDSSALAPDAQDYTGGIIPGTACTAKDIGDLNLGAWAAAGTVNASQAL